VRKVSARARSRISSLGLSLRAFCSSSSGNSGWSNSAPRISSRGSESAPGFSLSILSCQNSSWDASVCSFGEAKWIHC
jgi:hypothetical protein